MCCNRSMQTVPPMPSIDHVDPLKLDGLPWDVVHGLLVGCLIEDEPTDAWRLLHLQSPSGTHLQRWQAPSRRSPASLSCAEGWWCHRPVVRVSTSALAHNACDADARARSCPMTARKSTPTRCRCPSALLASVSPAIAITSDIFAVIIVPLSCLGRKVSLESWFHVG